MGQDLLTVEASRSHSDTPHSVVLLCTCDQSDAVTYALDSAATGISTASAAAAATAAAATTTTTPTTTHSFILVSYKSTASSKASSAQITI